MATSRVLRCNFTFAHNLPRLEPFLASSETIIIVHRAPLSHLIKFVPLPFIILTCLLSLLARNDRYDARRDPQLLSSGS